MASGDSASSDDSERSRSDLTGPIWARIGRWRHVLVALAVAGVLAAVWIALSHLAQEITYDDVVAQLVATPWSAVLAALVFTALSFVALSFYDYSALILIGQPRPWPQAALTSFFAFSVGNIAGFGPLTGGAIRYRFYSSLGLDAVDVGKIVAIVITVFGLGLLAVTGLGLVLIADQVAASLRIPALLLRVAGFAALAVILALFALSLVRPSLKIGRFSLDLPPPRILALQLFATIADIAAAGMALWVLLPDIGLSLPAFIAVFAVALGLGVLSHLPGGIGVFEAVILGVATRTALADQVLGALLLFRAIYYLVPLGVAGLAASLLEARRLALSPLGRAGTRLAPSILSALTFVLGTLLVFSGVTPANPDALDVLANIVPLPIIEASHFLASILGLGLLVIARGLAFRLNGAWWAAMIVIPLAAVLSLVKAVALIETVLLGLLACGLFATHREFNRPSSLTQQFLSPPWIIAILTILVTAFAVLMFAYSQVEYTRALWWEFEFSSEAPRSLRALLGVALLAGFVAIWSLIRHAPPSSVDISDHDFDNAIAIVGTQDQADANLIRMGDKAVMFSTDRRAFIMYGVQARSWIALFDPVGPREAWPELIWRFVETARAAGCRAVFYQVSGDNLSLYADVGLRAFKLGEEARIPLTDFDLQGSQRSGLRQTYNRGQRDGLSFELVPREDVPRIYDDIAHVSDTWVAHHRAREKGFSLGAFDKSYILSQPVGLLRRDGRIIAFATIMETATREEASVDLMRFLPEAPGSAMEFLFIALCLHFRAGNYRWFRLGMAPLSGMSDRPSAPLWHKIGRLVFAHGERFYNFRGLRAFKQKFRPEWHPRYLAVLGGIEPALALADTTALIGRGLKKGSGK